MHSRRNKLISVIIPTYNNGTFLVKAIDSVLTQEYSPIEIIVVDDGSTDNTKELLTPLLGRITYLQQENKGPAATRNFGIKNSSGDFIAFLDADDLWTPGKIVKQMHYFAKDQEIALIYGKIENFIDSTQEVVSITPPQVFSGMIFDMLLTTTLIPLPTVIVKQSVLDKVGLFNETLLTAEDTNLWLRIAMEHKIIGVDEVFCKRRKHSGNLSEKVNIPIGTLGNLHNIVTIFPQTAPKIYKPMREAYISRGSYLLADLFHGGSYHKCRKISGELLKNGFWNATIIKYFLISRMPLFFIKNMKKIIQTGS